MQSFVPEQHGFHIISSMILPGSEKMKHWPCKTHNTTGLETHNTTGRGDNSRYVLRRPLSDMFHDMFVHKSGLRRPPNQTKPNGYRAERPAL